jgi:peroxiredoxin
VENIAGAGATLAAIAPQVQQTAREAEQGGQRALPFLLLRDRGNAVARGYGLVYTLPEQLRQAYRALRIDLAVANEDESWTLPVPARFVLDRQGIIRLAEADPDYRRRPESAGTLAVLRQLGAEASSSG